MIKQISWISIVSLLALGSLSWSQGNPSKLIPLQVTVPGEFQVPQSGFYQLQWKGALPVGEVALWVTEKSEQILVSRNRGSDGKLQDKWETNLTQNTTYFLTSQGSLTKGSVMVSPSGWGQLSAEIKTELTPPTGDWQELAWVGKLPVNSKSTNIKGFSWVEGELIGLEELGLLQIFQKVSQEWKPLGEPLALDNLDDWTLGFFNKKPVVFYSLTPSDGLKAETHLLTWDAPLWQTSSSPQPDTGGQVKLINFQGKLEGSYWKISEGTQWKLYNFSEKLELPSPPQNQSVSALYHLAQKDKGLWAVFQVALGQERWYQIFNFDGQFWGNLNFPVIKKPRSFVMTPGPSPLTAVVDGQGKLLLFRYDKGVWQALDPPEGWSLDKQSTLKIMETNAGVYLISSNPQSFKYQRLIQGIWSKEVFYKEGTLLDLWNNPDGGGSLAAFPPGEKNSINIYTLP